MSDHVNHRRKARRIRKRPEWVYEHPKVERKPQEEKIDVPAKEQMEIIEALAGYFRRKSTLAISLGALPASDRDYYEAVMGDAAIRSLPYFDPTRGVKKTTFVIECVENYLINESIASNQLKRKAVLVPITNEDIQAAREQGLAAEEELVAGRRHSFNDILLEMDFRQFLSSLTPLERLLLDYRLHDLTFAEIAELRGMPVTTWKRREWKSVQDKAVKFGGLEPHGKPNDDGTEGGEMAR